MKVFIDTNVLIDFVCSRQGFVEAAKTIFLMGHEGEIELILSSLSFVNCFYIGKRCGFNVSQLRASLTAIESFVAVAATNQEVIHNSLSSTLSDFEDATQYYSAVGAGSDLILTRNKKDFTNVSIPVLTPDEFLNIQ